MREILFRGQTRRKGEKVRFDTVTNSECTELFFGHDEEALGEVEVIGNIHDNPELLEVE